jgi:hypothetical protein
LVGVHRACTNGRFWRGSLFDFSINSSGHLNFIVISAFDVERQAEQIPSLGFVIDDMGVVEPDCFFGDIESRGYCSIFQVLMPIPSPITKN